MFGIDDKQIKRYERDLKAFAHRAYPFATKETVNKSAFTAMRIAKMDIAQDLTLRNRFTVQSIRVEQTKTLDVRRQAAIVGSTADYMKDQEFGAIKAKRGKEGIPIATAYSAGQGMGKKPRTRLPRKANKLQNIRLKKLRTPKNKKQALVLKVQEAVNSGKRNIFHDFGGRKKKGFFRVVGGKRNVKRGWPGNARLKMLYDLSEQTVSIPRRPWLAPAVKKTQKNFMAGIYRESLIFQLKRQGLFKK